MPPGPVSTVAVLERGNARRTDRLRAAGRKLSWAFLSISGTELARQMTEQACTFGAEIVYTEAVGLEKTPAGFRVLCTDGVLRGKNGDSCDRCGAPVSWGLRQEDALTGCGVSYCAVCDGAFYEGLDVAVVGGGDTAVQDALLLANTCRSVTLIHRRNAFRASPHLVSCAEAAGEYPDPSELYGTEASSAWRCPARCGASESRNRGDGAAGYGRSVHRSRSGPAECSFSGSRCGRERVLSGG